MSQKDGSQKVGLMNPWCPKPGLRTERAHKLVQRAFAHQKGVMRGSGEHLHTRKGLMRRSGEQLHIRKGLIRRSSEHGSRLAQETNSPSRPPKLLRTILETT